MSRDSYPARWAGRQAIVTRPRRIEASNAGRIREELLLVINRGAIELIPVYPCLAAATAAASAAASVTPKPAARLRPSGKALTELPQRETGHDAD